MLPVMLSMRDKLPPGMYPSLVESHGHLWEIAENVIFTDEGVRAGWKRGLILSNADAPIRGMGTQRTGALGQVLFFGTLTKLWRSTAMATPVDVSNGTYTTTADASASGLAGMWHFANWGEWMLASNGKEQVQVYKSGPKFETLTQTAGIMPFTYGKCLGKFGPHIFVANTNNSAFEVRWCSADDIHDWIPTANNSAGDYIIRDLESAIVAAVPLGDRWALYATNSMYVMTYIGGAFIFGFTKAQSGVGSVGSKAVCAAGRLNYGLSYQGFYVTDGTQATYIDEPAIRLEFLTRVDKEQISKTVAYHNKEFSRIEWFYWTNSADYEGLAYDYRLKAWSFITDQYTAALEKDVFQYALVANANGNIYAVDTGTYPAASLQSKYMDFGAPQRGKFLSHVYLQYNGSLQLSVFGKNHLNDSPSSYGTFAMTGANTPVRVGTTARYFSVNIAYTNDATDWRLGGLEFYGKGGGLRK